MVYYTYTVTRTDTGEVVDKYFYNLAIECCKDDKNVSRDIHLDHFKNACKERIRKNMKENKYSAKGVSLSGKLGKEEYKNIKMSSYKRIEPPEGSIGHYDRSIDSMHWKRGKNSNLHL